MKLSVILSARDTEYGGPFVERMYKALSENMRVLSKVLLPEDYEIIIVDYNPLGGRYLTKNNLLKPILSSKNIKNIIVDNSVILNEKLTPTTFYEYFAKNAGIRASSGEFLFITNADIVFSPELVEEVKNEFDSPDKDLVFYRCRYRVLTDINSGFTPHGKRIMDLKSPESFDACVCGLYSGDASMFSRNVMFNVAKGYNEELPQHRTELCQTSMDGEILWNCYHNGLRLKFLNKPYFHIEHSTGHSGRDNYYHLEKYENKPDWGYINYRQEKIAENITKIFH